MPQDNLVIVRTTLDSFFLQGEKKVINLVLQMAVKLDSTMAVQCDSTSCSTIGRGRGSTFQHNYTKQ